MEIDGDNVLCPYCQSKCGDSDDFEGEDIWAEESIDFKCEECGKKFEARRVVTVDYRTESDCEINGEKHEAGEYHCKKCDSYDCNVKKHDSLSESDVQ